MAGSVTGEQHETGSAAAGTGAAPAGFRVRALARDAPAAVWWLTGLLAALLALSVVLHPPFRGPDEPRHVDLVAALERGELPLRWEPGTRTAAPGVVAGYVLPNTRLPQPQRLGDRPEVPHDRWPTWSAASALDPADLPAGVRVDLEQRNQLVGHPPAYYALLAGVLSLVPSWEERDLVSVVGLLRTAGALLLLPLPLLAFGAARVLGAPREAGVAAAAVVVAPPQLVHVGASVNNDRLLVLAAAVAALMCLRLARGDTSTRTALWLGGAVAVGLLTKGLMLPLLAVVGLALGVAARSQGLRPVMRPAAVVAGVGALGLWWWVLNLVEHSAVQPDGRGPQGERERTAGGLGEAVGEWAPPFISRIVHTTFFDEPSGTLPGGPLRVAAVVAAVLVVALVVTGAVRCRGGRLGAAATAVLPALLLYGLAAVGSLQAFRSGVTGAGMQGRYGYGAVIGVAALVAVAVAGRRRAPVAVIGVVLVLHALAAADAFRAYWWSADAGAAASVGALLERAPWPAAVTAAAAVAALVALAGALVTGVRVGPRDAGPDAATVRP